MSWGERSCKHGGKCPIPEECTMGTCNVNCREYVWDGETPADSKFADYETTKKAMECYEKTKPAPFNGLNRHARRRMDKLKRTGKA